MLTFEITSDSGKSQPEKLAMRKYPAQPHEGGQMIHLFYVSIYIYPVYLWTAQRMKYW